MKATRVLSSLLEILRARFAPGEDRNLRKVRELEQRVRTLEAEIKGLKGGTKDGSHRPTARYSGQTGKERP